MSAYYNENDPFAADWLRGLILEGLIPAGDVDERSIQEVAPNDLEGYTQCHFFAGIGGWAYALRLAGWPDDRPVWTGSCPCQPFSNAGKRGGVDDERHLWPDWRWLLDQCRPARVFGEQVASKAGRAWLAGVQADLEAMGYGTAAADLCAAGVGAPHIRQRLWWVGEKRMDNAPAPRQQPTRARTESEARDETRVRGSESRRLGSGGVAESERGAGSQERPHGRGRGEGSEAEGLDERSISDGSCGGMADPELPGASRHGQHGGETEAQGRIRDRSSDSGCNSSRLEHPNPARRPEGRLHERSGRQDQAALFQPWISADWIPCADGKARRIEPGLEPLVDGTSARVGRLRGYGNAIVPQVAAQFIQAVEEAIEVKELLA